GDEALGFLLHQRRAQGDGGGIEPPAAPALGRQLTARGEQTVLNLLLQGLADGCYCTRRQCLHQGLPFWTSPAPGSGTPRRTLQGLENSASLGRPDDHPMTNSTASTAERPDKALRISNLKLVYAVIPGSAPALGRSAGTSNCHATGLPWLRYC